tara:strand:+ start:572 stop:1069 length:498 start_codon:yes stop_codon:yes gene_type:complete
MATLISVNPELIQSDNSMETTKKRILNGQTWNKGQWLFTNTSDLLKACASDADAGTGGIKFVALTDQTDPGDSTTLAEVGVITSDMIWGMNELNGTVALTDVGAQFNINVTSNVVTVDVDDVTDIAVEITDLGATLNPIKYVVADVKAKVYAKVIPAVLEAAQVA